jgi:hypothetical protein
VQIYRRATLSPQHVEQLISSVFVIGLLDSIVNGRQALYIDFTKAFDSTVLSKLLLKLELYGISGLLLKWISGFLTNRTQCVVIDYWFSTQCAVISGVPQGSVL